jgi:flagellar M-ring protein FliF
MLLQNPIAKQLGFMVGIAGSVALGIVLYTSIQEPIYRPLDYQVNSRNMASIIDTLDKAGVKYKLNEQDGVIYVAAKDIQLAKMKLSVAGIPRDDSFNFSYLNDQGSIGNSQFLENARYLRALEADLSKTISSIEGVSAARVHIAIPQNNVFADENGRPTASVVLSMSPGLMSDKEKIRAIVQVIASSVPGLDPKDVAITDQYGHYLSGALDGDGIYSAEQMSYQNNMQRYYEKRIETMIVPLIGENKLTVRVQADIDFTRHEEAKESFDSADQVLRSEQSLSEENSSPAGASGAPGSLSNSPPQSGQNTQGGSPGGAPGATQSSNAVNGDKRSQSTKNYEIGKSVIYRKNSTPKINALSVAVVIDNEMVMDPKTKKMISKPLDPEKIAKITDLVKATIGYNEKRGDKVTVVNSSFSPIKNDEEFPTVHIWDQVWFWDMLKKFLGMTAGFGFLFVIYRQFSKHLKESANEKPIGISFMNESDPYSITPEMQELKQEQINRLKEMANREPNRVALVIKNWVGKP